MMKPSRSLFQLLILASFSIGNLHGQNEVVLIASKDNTLYENAAGSLSNGTGQHFFAGNNSGNLSRRALLSFDLAIPTIPANTQVASAVLTLNMSRTTSGGEVVELHRAEADWGEGTSAASGQEGGGGAATTNDATWLHRFFDSTTWAQPGGDFSSTISAEQTVAGLGEYSWGSTPQMVADVQGWIDNPGSNFGWVLVGNESSASSAKRFDTHENATAANQPRLTITFSNVTSVDDEPVPLPVQFELAQNYPNPFNPTTTVAYTVPFSDRRALPVRLEVFNLTGQKIRTLVRANQPGGSYSVVWDGLSDAGVTVPSGTYIYRLFAGRSGGAARAMTLIK